jgi:hypothetical protein
MKLLDRKHVSSSSESVLIYAITGVSVLAQRGCIAVGSVVPTEAACKCNDEEASALCSTHIVNVHVTVLNNEPGISGS